jgi:hypothetical protein
MPVVELLDHEHAVRYVGLKNQRRDPDTGEFEGLHWFAFDLRPGEPYLSINCLEKAGDQRPAALAAIKKCLAAKNLRGALAVLAIGKSGEIKDAFVPHRVRLTHEAADQDPSYGALRRMPLERRVALEKLAVATWAEVVELASV